MLESRVQDLQSDVSEIKSDIKGLVASQAAVATALAVREAAELQRATDRGGTGVWVRSMLPVLLMAIAILLTIINTFDITVVGVH